MKRLPVGLLPLCLVAWQACRKGEAPAPPPPPTTVAPASQAATPPVLIPKTQKTDDLDGMVKRRVIRALVVPTRTQYWVDQGQQTGVEYELLTAFEAELNRKHAKLPKHVKIHVLFVPTSRDQLIPKLLDGRGDLAAGILTITPERLQQVDFGGPFVRGVKEIAVTGPASPPLASVDDLSGKEVFVRRSASYWSHLEALNEHFRKEGKPPAKLRAAPEDLQDDDLLEMLNAGLFGITVVDRYAALLWARILKGIKPHEEVVVNEGGEIGWMIRKNSPLLKAEIGAFAAKHGQGTAFGRSVARKYVGSTRFVKPATSPEEIKKFQRTVDLFRKYSGQYDMDYLLMMAQGYQESRLDQNAKSAVGAVGVMQVMPATGQELKVGDIHKMEPNIHAGVKYIRFVQDQFFQEEPMDALNKTLFAFAAYNAGPGRVRQLRREAEKRELNPNVWFNNVEIVAAERIGAETVTYVANIYKYYVAYKLVTEDQEARRKARQSLAR